MSSTNGGSGTARPDVTRDMQTSLPKYRLLNGMGVGELMSIIYVRYEQRLVLNER
jgi:hypothetical protein